jgi:ABC-type molybdate transport system substrate-binding protein
VVRSSRHRQSGTVFLDVLAGPEGQRVLVDAGFSGAPSAQ